MNTIFCSQMRHELRDTFAVRGWQEGAILIALTIVFDQVRKILFEKGKKDRGGAWLEKQRIGEDVTCPGFGCGFHDAFKIGRGIGDAGKYGTAAYADIESSLG